jgi:hypothetical protein
MSAQIYFIANLTTGKSDRGRILRSDGQLLAETDVPTGYVAKLFDQEGEVDEYHTDIVEGEIQFVHVGPRPTPSPEDVLSALKDEAIQKITRDVAAVRALFLTPGQDLTYKTKEDSARAWAPGADPEQFPMLQNEANLRSITLEEMVGLVIYMADRCRTIDSTVVEPRRVQANLEIAAAASAEEVATAATVNWIELVAAYL